MTMGTGQESRHGFETLCHIVSLDELDAQFGANPARQAEVLGVSYHGFTHRRNAQDGNPVAQPGVHQPGHVVDRLGFELAADIHLHGQC